MYIFVIFKKLSGKCCKYTGAGRLVQSIFNAWKTPPVPVETHFGRTGSRAGWQGATEGLCKGQVCAWVCEGEALFFFQEKDLEKYLLKEEKAITRGRLKLHVEEEGTLRWVEGMGKRWEKWARSTGQSLENQRQGSAFHWRGVAEVVTNRKWSWGTLKG